MIELLGPAGCVSIEVGVEFRDGGGARCPRQGLPDRHRRADRGGKKKTDRDRCRRCPRDQRALELERYAAEVRHKLGTTVEPKATKQVA